MPSQVQFSRGKSSTTLRGTLRRDEQKEYALTARAGQRLTCRLTVTLPHSLRLTLSDASGHEVPLQSQDAHQWMSTLPETGEYTLTVARLPMQRPAPSIYALFVTLRR